MRYLVVETNAWYTNGKSYDTLAGARRGSAAMNKREINYCVRHDVKTNRSWAAMSSDTFHESDAMVESFNLMSGKKVMIRKSQQGTCVDPSTERYWSM